LKVTADYPQLETAPGGMILTARCLFVGTNSSLHVGFPRPLRGGGHEEFHTRKSFIDIKNDSTTLNVVPHGTSFAHHGAKISQVTNGPCIMFHFEIAACCDPGKLHETNEPLVLARLCLR
jgi:hypothetical protein